MTKKAKKEPNGIKKTQAICSPVFFDERQTPHYLFFFLKLW